MCNFMEIELGFSVNNSKDIVNHLMNEPSLSHLEFLKDMNFEAINIHTELDFVHNERINALFNNLGKSDVDSMLSLISSFRAYMIDVCRKYEEYYKTHARLYIAFGLLGGAAVSLMFI